uniref:Uncharacterized protein n=1 Tax=Oryza glumipatula TaxID=40148 RepID=A0A0D9Y6P5_9ORYZ
MTRHTKNFSDPASTAAAAAPPGGGLRGDGRPALAGVPMIRAHSHPPPHPSAPRRSSASCNHESTTKKKAPENEVWEGPPLVLAVLQLKTNRQNEEGVLAYAVTIAQQYRTTARCNPTPVSLN